MSTRKALALSFLDRYCGLGLSIVSSMAVARLLTPADIGVFSVAMVLLSFISAMRDFGAGQYLVQEKELTTERIRATWTVQLGLGISFAALVLIAAVPVADFYAERRIRDIMFVLALNFAISPFGSLTYAWLMREMKFESLALMRLAGSLANAGVTVTMAWLGFGPLSLAAGSLAATLANALVAVYFRPVSFPWLPGRTGVGRVLAVGGKVSMTSTINSLGASVPELVLGKLQGMAAVGLYSRANGLAAMFQRLMMDATQAVAMPLFSRATRDGEDPGPIFVKATAYVTAVGWSFFGALCVMAYPIVEVLYGAQWRASVPMLRMVALSMAIGLPSAFCSAASMGGGQMNALVRITAITVLQGSVIVAFGASRGLVELGWALVTASCVNVSTWLTMAPVLRRVDKLSLAMTLLRSLMVAAAATAGPLAAMWSMNGHSNVVRLVTGALTGTVAFAVAVLITRHPLRDELAFLTKCFVERRTTLRFP